MDDFGTWADQRKVFRDGAGDLRHHRMVVRFRMGIEISIPNHSEAKLGTMSARGA